MKFLHTEIAGYHWVSNPNDKYVGKSLQTYGEWSFGEIDLLTGFLPDTSCIIEVGGNIGAHTVPLSRHLQNGQVITFEPQRIAFQLLCANIINNDCSNVRAYNMAVGAVAGTTAMVDIDPARDFNFGGVSVGKIETGDDIAGHPFTHTPVVRLDDVIPSGVKIAALKCDAEGMEVAVLKGASALIERDKPLLYLEDDKVDLSVALFNTVRHFGYDIWWHPVPLFREQNLAGVRENIFKQIYSFNVFCCHPDNPVEVSGLKKLTHINDHPLLNSAGNV